MAILNLPNTAFRAELAARGGAAADGDGDELDIPLRGADSPGELTAITERIPRLAERGAIWVVSRKGPAARVKDVDIFAPLRPLGRVDTKVCAVSDSHPALKFVRRRKTGRIT